MIKKAGMLLLAGGIAVSSLLVNVDGQSAEAAPLSLSSDTGAEVLNYVENERRQAREDALTEDQKQLLMDAYEMRDKLRNPLDPSKNIPIAVEGDELFWDQNTGDMFAKGDVQITTLDERRFNTDNAVGNLKNQEIEIEGLSKLLQMPYNPGQSRIILTGYKTQYNYGQQVGKMEEISGRVGHQYVKGERFELYPDMMIIYNGTMTKCSAKDPDYHLSADRIEVWPNEKVVYYNVKYYLAGMLMGTKERQETDLRSDTGMNLPRAGYDSDNGFWVAQDWSYDVAPGLEAYVDVAFMTKENIKMNGGLRYRHPDFGTFTFSDGFYQDNDNIWIRKQNNIQWDFSRRMGDSPVFLNLQYIRGLWTQKPSDRHPDSKTSWHTRYYAGLSTEPIQVGAWKLSMAAGYAITEESFDESRVEGMDYNATLYRSFDDKWAYYLKYIYSEENSQNTLFDFDNDTFSKKLQTGLSYQVTDRDRVMATYAFDMDKDALANSEYYWFHDFHCIEMMVRYKSKRDSGEHSTSVSFMFNPW